MRIAWFSPLPPTTSGIAAYSAELLPLLHDRIGAIHLFVAADRPAPLEGALEGTTVYSAQSFVWRHRRAPYDLVIYQLGNAACHDYMWGYLFRYPGLVVLHDAQLHQSRALWLLRRLAPRRADYLAELVANHPEAPAHLGDLVAAGLGGSLYQHWPLVGLVLRAARLAVVHNAHLAAALGTRYPDAHVESIEMGVADAAGGDAAALATAARAARQPRGIPAEAVLVGAYGGITPEKRIPELLRAVAGLPEVHVLLVGHRADHYDVDSDVRALGLEGRVHITGYVADADLPVALAMADICACLRWPTSGETSASWLRCLSAGKPTLITALAQLAHVPGEVAIAIDPLDEPTALPAALLRLVHDADLRHAMGRRARAHWAAHHQLAQMADGYASLVARAAARPVPRLALPAHLNDDGSGKMEDILQRFGPELARP